MTNSWSLCFWWKADMMNCTLGKCNKSLNCSINVAKVEDMKEITRDRIRTTGSLSLLALSNQFNVHYNGMNKELLQVQEWMQKHIHSLISTACLLEPCPKNDWKINKSMYRDKGNQFSSIYYRFLLTDLFVQMDLFLEVPNNDLLVLHWAFLRPWSRIFVIKLI